MNKIDNFESTATAAQPDFWKGFVAGTLAGMFIAGWTFIAERVPAGLKGQMQASSRAGARSVQNRAA